MPTPFLRSLTLAVASAAALLAPPVASAADAPHAPVRIVIVGDSTVSNYPEEHPSRGWGMYVGEYFQDGTVQLFNHAAAGRSTKTFLSRPLEDKPDFVLI